MRYTQSKPFRAGACLLIGKRNAKDHIINYADITVANIHRIFGKWINEIDWVQKFALVSSRVVSLVAFNKAGVLRPHWYSAHAISIGPRRRRFVFCIYFNSRPQSLEYIWTKLMIFSRLANIGRLCMEMYNIGNFSVNSWCLFCISDFLICCSN